MGEGDEGTEGGDGGGEGWARRPHPYEMVEGAGAGGGGVLGMPIELPAAAGLLIAWVQRVILPSAEPVV